MRLAGTEKEPSSKDEAWQAGSANGIRMIEWQLSPTKIPAAVAMLNIVALLSRKLRMEGPAVRFGTATRPNQTPDMSAHKGKKASNQTQLSDMLYIGLLSWRV